MMRTETEILDRTLHQTLEHLQQQWFNEEVGIVAAALVGLNGEQVFATSTYAEDGKFTHAEANAVSTAKGLFEPEWFNTATAVVTLSPCVIPGAASRNGEPCAQVLVENGIHRVHVGALDSKQIPTIQEYRKHGLEVSQTAHVQLAAICYGLMELFGQFRDFRNITDHNPWPTAKASIYPRPFSGFRE